jgi:hypothetical protein
VDGEQTIESRIWLEKKVWAEFQRIESLHQKIRAQFELARRNYEMLPAAQGETHPQYWTALCEIVGRLRDATRAINELTYSSTAKPPQRLGDDRGVEAD